MSAVARSINSLNMSVNSTLQDSEMLLLSVEERHIPYSTLRLFEGLAEHGTMPYTSELVNYFLEPGESTDLIMFNACMAELQQADGQLTLPKDSKGSATFELFERMRRIAIDEYNLGGNEWDLFKERIEAIFSRPDILEELKKQGLLVIYSPFGIVDISGEKVELLPPVISVDTQSSQDSILINMRAHQTVASVPRVGPTSTGSGTSNQPQKKKTGSPVGRLLAAASMAIVTGALVISALNPTNSSQVNSIDSQGGDPNPEESVPSSGQVYKPIDSASETPVAPTLTATSLPTATAVPEGTPIVNAEDGFVEPTAEELANFAAETDTLLSTMGEEETLPAKSGEILIFNPASEKSIKLRARFERFMDLAAHGYYPVFATRSFAMETIKDGSTGFEIKIPEISADNLKQIPNIVYIRGEYVNDKKKNVWGDNPKDVCQNLIGPTPFRNLVFGKNNNQWTISADWKRAKVIGQLPEGNSEVLKTYFVGAPEKIKLWPRVSVIWFIAADDTLSSFLDSNSDWYTPELLRAQGMLYPIALDY